MCSTEKVQAKVIGPGFLLAFFSHEQIEKDIEEAIAL